MEIKYLRMLGSAVRNVADVDKEKLINEEVGAIIYKYVQSLENESMRDAREQQNRKKK